MNKGRKFVYWREMNLNESHIVVIQRSEGGSRGGTGFAGSPGAPELAILPCYPCLSSLFFVSLCLNPKS